MKEEQQVPPAEFIEGATYIIDETFANGGPVKLVRLGKHFSIVQDLDTGHKWQTMTNRLSKLPPSSLDRSVSQPGDGFALKLLNDLYESLEDSNLTTFQKERFEKLKTLLKHRMPDQSEAREALKGIMEIGKRDMSNPKYDGYFEAANEALKSQPSQLGEGKPFSEAIKDPSFHQKYWEDPPLPEQGKEDKIKADILREYQNDIFNSEHLLTKQMCYDAMEAYADQQVKAALKSKPTDGWSDELVRLYGEYSFRFSGFPSERENPEQWLSSYRKTKQ